MNLIPIIVECYSGHKADEYPICFYWNNIRFEIHEIVDRWYQSDPNSEWQVANYYKVRAINGIHHILKHEIEKDQWFLVTEDDKDSKILT